jgi:transcriptional regulator with XRE-family HTH domain
MNQAAIDTVRERHWICAQRLRERRRELKLTQLDVVTRLHGHGAEMTNRALSSMENGRGLDLGWLPELADALDCTVTYLLGLTADPASWLPDGVAPTARPHGTALPAPAVSIEQPGVSEPNGVPESNGSSAADERCCWILGPHLVDVTRTRPTPRVNGTGG